MGYEVSTVKSANFTSLYLRSSISVRKIDISSCEYGTITTVVNNFIITYHINLMNSRLVGHKEVDVFVLRLIVVPVLYYYYEESRNEIRETKIFKTFHKILENNFT